MAAFQGALPALRDAGVRVGALSTDDAEGARSTVEGLGLTFPVGHSADREATARRWGLFHEARRGILHAAAFLVDDAGRIAHLNVSAGAVGRLMPDELLGLVRFWDRDLAPSE